MTATRRACLRSLLLLGGMEHIFLSAIASQAAEIAMPTEVSSLGEKVQLQGALRFRYWGFHAYDIQLWTTPVFEALRYNAHPFALSITYARSIDLNDLVDRSLQEMSRQAPVRPQQAQAWRLLLIKALRHVEPGDRLTGLFRPPHQATFFFNGKITAVLDESPLVPHFFGIWLSEQTSQPALRQALLGLSNHDGIVNGW